MLTTPEQILAAPAHLNPYPFYADLAARAPFARAAGLQLWVAASAEIVSTILTHPQARVRPPGQPVPPALLDTPVAAIFKQLVRMRDDRARLPLRATLIDALGALHPAQIAECSTALARRLTAGAALTPAWLSDFIWRLPVSVVARLLGAPEADLPHVTAWLHDLVACLRPNADAATLSLGSAAASALRVYVGELITSPQARAGQAASGLWSLAHAAAGAGHDERDVLVANAVGLLMQSYEATAGLTGNTLVALASRPDLRTRLLAHPELLPAVLRELLRFDPPIHNTRRFLAQDAQIGGQTVRAGDAVLVVLAAANYDRRANPDPARFDPGRAAPRCFTFGAGSHACPGEQLALGIAGAAVRHLLAVEPDLKCLTGTVRYWPLTNARVPRFAVAAVDSSVSMKGDA